MTFRFCDDLGAYGFGWIVDEAMTRTSHALAADGKVWLVDALDWPDAIDRALALGEPAGVVQLLDRHERDCAALASRLGVPHIVAPDELPGSTFTCIPLMRRKRWRESALWWPEARTLVTADALGTNRFSTGGKPSTSSSATARASTARTLPARSATRCAPAAAGSRACSYACRSPAADSSPGRTRRGGATSPASFTGGFSGSASGAAENDARTRSWDGTPYSFHDGGLGILATTSRKLWDEAAEVLFAGGALLAGGHELLPPSGGG